MPPLNVSTDFTDNGTTPGLGRPIMPCQPRKDHATAWEASSSLLALPLLAASLAAAAWLFWLLANGVLGKHGTLLGVVSLIAGATALSRHTGRNFTGSLILVGFAGLSLLICGLARMAGYALIFWWVTLQAIDGPDHGLCTPTELNDPETNASVATFTKTCEHE